jgi:hypothetical protein
MAMSMDIDGSVPLPAQREMTSPTVRSIPREPDILTQN